MNIDEAIAFLKENDFDVISFELGRYQIIDNITGDCPDVATAEEVIEYVEMIREEE